MVSFMIIIEFVVYVILKLLLVYKIMWYLNFILVDGVRCIWVFFRLFSNLFKLFCNILEDFVFFVFLVFEENWFLVVVSFVFGFLFMIFVELNFLLFVVLGFFKFKICCWYFEICG